MVSLSMELPIAQFATSATPKDSITKLRKVTAEASLPGVHLILFPEAFLGGYPRTCGLAATVVGSHTDTGRGGYYGYWKQCADLGDSSWRDGTGTERIIWGIGSPKTLKAVEATIAGQKVTLGAAICWENYMLLLRTSLYAQGVSIYLAPTTDARESWISTIRHIAMEGRCFVLSCNQYLAWYTKPNYAPGFDNGTAVVSEGGSAIVDPMGKIIAGPLWREEGVLEIEIGGVERSVVYSKFGFDAGRAGHYGRNDVFKLSVEGLDLGRG